MGSGAASVTASLVAIANAQATQREREQNRKSLMEVHDGDGNLLAAVGMQFNPETKVSTVEFAGGVDHDALVAAQELVQADGLVDLVA